MSLPTCAYCGAVRFDMRSIADYSGAWQCVDEIGCASRIDEQQDDPDPDDLEGAAISAAEFRARVDEVAK